MKILGLCFVLCICLAPILNAQEPARPANDQAALLTSPESDRSLIIKSDNGSPDSLDNSCMYMRTYRVKRQYRGSDVVSPAGYTKCVPSRRFQTKSAVQVETGPPAGSH